MAHVGSLAKRSSKAFSVALHQNECSIARARSKSAWSFGSHDVANLTVPSLARPDSSASWACTALEARTKDEMMAIRRVLFICRSAVDAGQISLLHACTPLTPALGPRDPHRRRVGNELRRHQARPG